MLNLARPNTKDPGQQESGLLSLRKGEGQGEGDFIQITPARSRTPHLSPLPLRRGEAKEARVLEFKSKTARALPAGHGRAAQFAQ